MVVTGRRTAAIAVVGALALGAGACGDSSGGGDGGDETVDVTAILDLTGVAGATGTEARKGLEFQVANANRQLADSGKKIKLRVVDTGSVQTKAVSEAVKAAKSSADAVVFGNLSNEALAIAPILQKAAVPTVFIASGASGLTETGDHMFRVTGPQSAYQGLAVDHLKQAGVKSIAMVYASDNPTLTDLATKVWPTLLEEAGISETSKTSVKITDTDFSAIASKVAAQHPDAVFAGLLGAPNVTLLKQLRRNGWDGHYIGTNGIAFGVLSGLGSTADKVAYATDYHSATTVPAGKSFAAAFQQKTGAESNVFTGEGADAATFLMKAIQEASSTDRDGLLEGMSKVAEKGYDGIMGKVRFQNRSAIVPGILVTYNKGTASVPKAG
jgi:branched-chain amino acid transport system substrate-binding protein